MTDTAQLQLICASISSGSPRIFRKGIPGALFLSGGSASSAPELPGRAGPDPSQALSPRSPGVVALEVGWVHASQNQLPPLPSLHVTVQPEAEHRLLDHPLVQHLLEGRSHAAHSDLWEAQPLQQRICREC